MGVRCLRRDEAAARLLLLLLLPPLISVSLTTDEWGRSFKFFSLKDWTGMWQKMACMCFGMRNETLVAEDRMDSCMVIASRLAACMHVRTRRLGLYICECAARMLDRKIFENSGLTAGRREGKGFDTAVMRAGGGGGG